MYKFKSNQKYIFFNGPIDPPKGCSKFQVSSTSLGEGGVVVGGHIKSRGITDKVQDSSSRCKSKQYSLFGTIKFMYK